MITSLIEGFNNWEKDILMEYESDVEILVNNFVLEEEKEDFLHNFADILFRCKFNSLQKAKEEIKKRKISYKVKETKAFTDVVKWSDIEEVLGK